MSEQGFFTFGPVHFFVLVLFSVAVIAVLLVVIWRLRRSRAKKAEEIAERITSDLLTSRELFVKLYQTAPVPYVLLDEHETITYPNIAALRLFGANAEQIGKMRIFDRLVFEPEESFKRDLIVGQYRQNHSVTDQEVRLKRSDGSVRWVLLSLHPFSRADGSYHGIATMVDITRQKEIEEAKTEFVSLASHQLRTPLSSMLWHIELLEASKDQSLSEKQLQHVKTLERGAQRLSAILEGFLNVSRLELGTFTPVKKETNVAQCIDQLLADFEAQIRGKNLKLVKKVSVALMQTDVRMLRMALENLLSNAIRYTPADGEVRIFATENEKAIVFEVSDTGMGIPREDQRKLFSKMFRASNARKEVPDGTGLGLYIVKMIVDVLGGDIAFESEEGEGTTFTLTFPK